LHIECSTNAECGTNGYIGNPFCYDGDVYKTYRSYVCNNPGTPNSSCSTDNENRLLTNCTSNQTCSGGSCIDLEIACSSNAECGTNGYIGNPFCRDGDVYKTFRTYICTNPGTPSSSCSNTTEDRLQTNCSSSQTCSNGQCEDVDIACSCNADCGTNGFIGNPFCQNGDVYRTYRTYVCNNPGTPSSSCSTNTENRLATNCSSTQTCSNGQCEDVDIACDSNADCGTNGYIGNPFCKNGDVYKTYRTYICNNAGTVNSNCSSSTEDRLTTECSSNQQCSNGSCQTTCTDHNYRSCVGNSLYWFDSCGNQDELIEYCQYGCQNSSCIQQTLSVQTNSATNISTNQAILNGYLSGYNGYNSGYYNNVYVWFQWGTTTSYGYETQHQQMNYNNTFSQNITGLSANTYYHFRAVAQGAGGPIYGQDMTFSTGNVGNLLTVNKTVRNLSSGNFNWSTSAAASPSDILNFTITIQANSSQEVRNVVVKDLLPSRLILQNNSVVVSGANYNYSGNDIVYGVLINSIPAGQMVTITYSAQVASAANFSYGTTTLTNSVTVTAESSNPITGNANIVVTRTGVLGVTDINTGLTNNLLFDSFFIPLLLGLFGIWMYKSGALGFNAWLDSQKAKNEDFKANKELKARIAKIKSSEPWPTL